jgi:hypothetical protein
MQFGTIGKWLNQFQLTHLQPWPFHPKKDAAAAVAFKQDFAGLAQATLLATTAADGCAINGVICLSVRCHLSRPHGWGGHDRAACPNTEAMNLHLAERSPQIASDPSAGATGGVSMFKRVGIARRCMRRSPSTVKSNSAYPADSTLLLPL